MAVFCQGQTVVPTSLNLKDEFIRHGSYELRVTLVFGVLESELAIGTVAKGIDFAFTGQVEGVVACLK